MTRIAFSTEIEGGMDYSSLWLNWQPINEPPAFMSGICAAVHSVSGRAALRELQEGFAAMAGRRPAELTAAAGACLHIVETDAEGESYAFVREGDALRLEGGARGLVFGAFDLLRGLALGRREFEGASAPRYSVRMLDHWVPRARHSGMQSQVGLRKHHYEQS